MNIFLQSLAIMMLSLSSLSTCAQMKTMDHKMPTVKLISTIDVQEEIDGEMARSSTVEVFFNPNEASMPHRHPGPVYGYIS